MDIHEAQQYLNSFINYELRLPDPCGTSFKLQRVHKLLGLLGNPQNQLKVIHVAGSKGKGSTAALTATILAKAGCRVGLYTSPHLSDYRERIRLLGNPNQEKDDLFPDAIGRRDFVHVLETIKARLEGAREDADLRQVTFFELFTILAFCYFAREKADWVVLETGMGGRLDATNVAPSLVCAITPISLEHTQFLGNTLDKIAAEKAAIIKEKGQRVVLAPQEESVREVLEARCLELGIRPVYVSRDIRFECVRQDVHGQSVTVSTQRRMYPRIGLKLLGRHQAVNAAVAIGIIEALDFWTEIPVQAVYAGCRDVFWPGRLEVLGESPDILIDGAHNQASAQILAENVERFFPGKKVVLVLGVSGDKDLEGMCRSLRPIAGRVVFTRAAHPRARNFTEEEARVLFPGCTFHLTVSVADAIALARRNAVPGEIILITGSLFVVAEARDLLTKKAIGLPCTN